MGQFAEVTYDGGTANAGPAIRINAAAGRFRFYGLVALYIPAQTGIALVLYNGENLAGIGTVIDTFFVTLIAGDVIRIEAGASSVTSYSVKLNGTTVISATLSESQISPLNSCVGFVEVFTVPSGTIVVPVGACILPDTSCIIATEADCIAAGGTYQGDSVPCPGEEPMVIVKSADESKTNNTAMAFDSQLKVAIGANETWVFRGAIRIIADSGVPDIKYGFFGPAGSNGFWIDENRNFTKFDLGVTVIDSASTLETDLAVDVICVNGATPGDFGFQWAQNTSSGDATKIRATSFLVASKKV